MTFCSIVAQRTKEDQLVAISLKIRILEVLIKQKNQAEAIYKVVNFIKSVLANYVQIGLKLEDK